MPPPALPPSRQPQLLQHPAGQQRQGCASAEGCPCRCCNSAGRCLRTSQTWASRCATAAAAAERRYVCLAGCRSILWAWQSPRQPSSCHAHRQPACGSHSSTDHVECCNSVHKALPCCCICTQHKALKCSCGTHSISTASVKQHTAAVCCTRSCPMHPDLQLPECM
jgi:hypothetical protein